MPDEEAKKERKPSHPPPELAKKIPVTRLFPFPDHPFSVSDDDSMRELIFGQLHGLRYTIQDAVY